MGMKSNSNMFHNTKGSFKYQLDIQKFGLKNFIKKLPPNPDSLLNKGWKEITHPSAKAKSNSLEYQNFKTKHKLRFDRGNTSENGYKAIDHYHVYNPNSTGNHDLYLDKNGKPVKKNSKVSHLLPKKETK